MIQRSREERQCQICHTTMSDASDDGVRGHMWRHHAAAAEDMLSGGGE